MQDCLRCLLKNDKQIASNYKILTNHEFENISLNLNEAYVRGFEDGLKEGVKNNKLEQLNIEKEETEEIFDEENLKNKLVELSKAFAVDVIKLCERLQKSSNLFPLINQLLKSGTSIGANIHEANYAASRADFINKLQIALKECYETDYWLGLFKESNMISADEYSKMYNKCSKIRTMLISSVNTAKSHLNS